MPVSSRFLAVVRKNSVDRSNFVRSEDTEGILEFLVGTTYAIFADHRVLCAACFEIN